MRLKDKVAIITGAASGIGCATALAMAREGARVVIGDIDAKGAEKVATEIRNSGGVSLAAKADISNRAEVNQMVERTIAQFGRVDILVNNASLYSHSFKPFAETELEDWHLEIDTTLVGTLLCTRAVLPHMIKQKSGRIIIVASDAGKHGAPMLSMYSTCKAAVAGFTRALALELSTKGITANSVSPGLIMTPRIAKRMSEFPELAQKWRSLVPMGKIGEPEDVAKMMVFLASDDASYITGQDYSVDGGIRM